MSSSHETRAPALPSFHDESKANLIPFGVVCAAWLAPLLKFWAMIWGVFRPPDSTVVAPQLWSFLAACLLIAGFWWLPSSYYRTRSFEANGRVYELLGVRVFRMFVPNGDFVNLWRRRRDPRFRVISSYHSAETYFRRTIIGEKTHLVSFAVGCASSMFAWHIGWAGWAAYLAGGNVLFNVYPILLQRYTRARLVRALARSRRHPPAA